ncbi:MAG: hypothetical protein WB297_01600 [Actinomycetota bacterium]
MTPCPHPGLQVGGRCYFCLKQAATNGHRSKLSAEALAFVGFGPELEHDDRAWVPAAASAYIEEKQLELAALLDTMPGWYSLARRILEDDDRS